MHTLVPTGNAWGDIVGYSRAVRAGNLIFVSGTTASGSDGQALHPGQAGPQARVILERIEAALVKLGSSLEHAGRQIPVDELGHSIGGDVKEIRVQIR